jgi:predicted lipoprotein with Yx(FWY)xxD motif
MKSTLHSGVGRWRNLTLVIGAAAFLAACGGNTTSAAPAAPAPGGSAGGGSASGSAAVVMAHSGPLGTYLTDASGRTLYLFATDTGSASTCVGNCAAEWPPLTTAGAPQAGSGATASELSTTMRTDGSTQVDYHGHPLYYFAADTSAGDAKGQGVDNGGLWWVVSPAGDSIQSTAASTSGAGGGGDAAWS